MMLFFLYDHKKKGGGELTWVGGAFVLSVFFFFLAFSV